MRQTCVAVLLLLQGSAALVPAAERTSAPLSQLGLLQARVSNVKQGTVCDRVCIDLVQTLAVSEGCLVGDTPDLLAFVQAEVLDSGFVPARYLIPALTRHEQFMFAQLTAIRSLLFTDLFESTLVLLQGMC
jgi:hypothetical protein